MDKMRNAKFKIGHVVKHRTFIRCHKQTILKLIHIVSGIAVLRKSLRNHCLATPLATLCKLRRANRKAVDSLKRTGGFGRDGSRFVPPLHGFPRAFLRALTLLLFRTGGPIVQRPRGASP
jgi:hypothetical protein